MKKYLQVASLEWRNALAYRGNTWISAFFLMFKVLLAYMLWRAVFGGQDTFGGMTLPEMVTYYLISSAIAPLTRGDGLIWDFSREIRSGQYSKYIVRPISPLGYFISASSARAILPAAAGVVVLGGAVLLFGDYFIPLSGYNVLMALVVTLLALLLNNLLGYIISSMAFKFIDIGGFYIINNIIKDFLSGALIPLHLVFGNGAPAWSPFSYMVYYPVMLAMGKSDIPPLRAIMILLCWCAAFLVISIWMQKRAPKAFEGVGI